MAFLDEVACANRARCVVVRLCRFVFLCAGIAVMVFSGAREQFASSEGDGVLPSQLASEPGQRPLAELLSPTGSDIVFGVYRVRVRQEELPDGWQMSVLYEPILGVSRIVPLSSCNRENVSPSGDVFFDCDLLFASGLDSKAVEIQIHNPAGDIVSRYRVVTRNYMEELRVEETGACEVMVKLGFNESKVESVIADPSILVATLGGSISTRRIEGGGSELNLTGLELDVIEVKRLEPPSAVVVVFVLDSSRSMGDPGRLKELFDKFVEQLEKSNAAGAIVRGNVIRFSDTAESATHGTTSDFSAIRRALGAESIGRGTNLWAGVNAGVRAALKARADSTRSARVEVAILMVTDAEASSRQQGSASDVLGVLSDAGITLNIVRVNSELNRYGDRIDGSILGLAKESGGKVFAKKELLDALPVALSEDVAGKYMLKVAPKNGDWRKFRSGIRQGRSFRVSVLGQDGNPDPAARVIAPSRLPVLSELERARNVIGSRDALPLQKADSIRTAMLHIDGKEEARSGELIRFASRLLGDYEKTLMRLSNISIEHWEEIEKRWEKQLVDLEISEEKRKGIRREIPALRNDLPRLASELESLKKDNNLYGLAALLSSVSTTEAKRELVEFQEATFDAIAKCICSTVLRGGMSGEEGDTSKKLSGELVTLLESIQKNQCDGIWKIENTRYKPYLDAVGRYVAALLLERYGALLDYSGGDKTSDHEFPVSSTVLATYAEVKAIDPLLLKRSGADTHLRHLKPIQELYDHLIVLGIAP